MLKYHHRLNSNQISPNHQYESSFFTTSLLYLVAWILKMDSWSFHCLQPWLEIVNHSDRKLKKDSWTMSQIYLNLCSVLLKFHIDRKTVESFVCDGTQNTPVHLIWKFVK